MTQTWTEQDIAAFVDGSLEKDKAMRIEEILADDRDARAVAEEIRRSNDLLRAAYADIATAPVPPALLKPMMGADPKVVPFARRWPKQRTWLPAAAAASVAIVIGLAVGTTWGPIGGGEQIAVGDAPQGSPLQIALETVPSGTLHDGRVLPMLSFRDDDGRYCREFEVAGNLQDELELGIACRTAPAVWHVEIIVTSPMTERDQTDFVPAEGPGADALGAMLDALGAGLPLSPSEEGKLLEEGWQVFRPSSP